MKPLITICARGGSKGLPGKNIKEMNGKPLICWTIEQALEWGKGDIIVSSDDKYILDIARRVYGVGVIERPPQLSLDDTPKLDVLRHAVGERLLNYFNIRYCSQVIDLDVTNPLRTVSDIDKCYRIFQEKRPKTLVSVTKARKNPYFNQINVKNGKYGVFDDKYTDRQSTPKAYDLNSSIYIYDIPWLMGESMETNHPVTDNTIYAVMKDWQAFDIDNEVDFFIVEQLMRRYMLNEKISNSV